MKPPAPVKGGRVWAIGLKHGEITTMLAHTSRPFVFSALLHATAAGLLLMLMLQARHEPMTELHVIELVPDALLAQVVRDTPRARAIPSEVNFTPMRVVVPVREQAPAAESVEQSLPVVRRQPPQSRAVVVTSGHPQMPSSRRTTIAEYRHLHPEQNAPGRTGVAPGKINLAEVLAEATPGPAQSVVVADGSQAAAYFERLVARLRAAHEKPAGLGDDLEMQVGFTLRADGLVSDVRILKSSGSDEFDASVLMAFRRLRDLGLPPAGAAGANKITFRTRAN